MYFNKHEMKISIILVLLLMVVLLNRANVSHTILPATAEDLKETPINQVPLELKKELLLLKKNLKKYENVKQQEIKDSTIIVIKDSIIKK